MVAMVKMSVSVDEDTARRIREQAAADGVPVSQLVDEAMAAALRTRALRAALQLLDEEFGPVPAEELERARAEVRSWRQV